MLYSQRLITLFEHRFGGKSTYAFRLKASLILKTNFSIKWN